MEFFEMSMGMCGTTYTVQCLVNRGSEYFYVLCSKWLVGRNTRSWIGGSWCRNRFLPGYSVIPISKCTVFGPRMALQVGLELQLRVNHTQFPENVQVDTQRFRLVCCTRYQDCKTTREHSPDQKPSSFSIHFHPYMHQQPPQALKQEDCEEFSLTLPYTRMFDNCMCFCLGPPQTSFPLTKIRTLAPPTFVSAIYCWTWANSYHKTATASALQ